LESSQFVSSSFRSKICYYSSVSSTFSYYIMSSNTSSKYVTGSGALPIFELIVFIPVIQIFLTRSHVSFSLVQVYNYSLILVCSSVKLLIVKVIIST